MLRRPEGTHTRPRPFATKLNAQGLGRCTSQLLMRHQRIASAALNHAIPQPRSSVRGRTARESLGRKNSRLRLIMRLLGMQNRRKIGALPFGGILAMRFVGTRFALVVAAMVTMDCVCYAQPIYHEINYPRGDGPFPVVIALHTSGGFKTVKRQIAKYTGAGYTVYAPDFFARHGISHSNRLETWTKYRSQIEAELLEIIAVIKKDPKADAENIFAVGFSNGGYWSSFLAARKHVNAGASHYGVWSWPPSAGWDGYPAAYFDSDSNPVLAIHGDSDSVQKPRFVYPQLDIVEERSPKFTKHIFSNAGHSWDCKPCRQDGHDQEATRRSLQLTLELFEANKR